jgi:type 2 lantibiotic biosynthesis protein LanM
MYSRQQLTDLAVRAATIDERLSAAFVPAMGSREDADTAANRLAAWCRSAASGDWKLFAKRLKRDRLSMDEIMPRLATVALSDPSRLPQWTEDAAWIVPAMLTVISAADIATLRDAGVIEPFDALFFGLVGEAEQRRDALLSKSVIDRVEPEVLQSISRQLLASVTKLCGMAIYENFAVCRDAWAKEKASVPASPTRHYDRFIGEMRRAGVRRMFDTKPVLLRLLASLTRQWIEATAEFLNRLDADFEALRRDLIGKPDAVKVSFVEMGLSDLHKFGRSVYIVRFADGTAAVYKPKDMTVDLRWIELIDWLNSRDAPIDLKAVGVLARDGYGWSEFVIHGDCPDAASASRFFRRAGGLLSLFYLMVGSDMHDENMIAAGEYPMPIDLEMVLQAHDPGAATGAPAMLALEAAQKKLNDSVLTVGLLPAFMRTPETAMMSVGGLNDAETGKPQEIIWADINRDGMNPVQEPWKASKATNLPRLDGKPIRLIDYLDDLSEGCGSYLRFIRDHKSELLADNGPIAAFADASIRRVLKPTRFYFLLLDRVRNHRDMRDGAVWSAHLDFVARLADWDKDEEKIWSLFAAERAALADLNIPFFVHAADSDRVRDGGGTAVATSGLMPALVEAKKRIAAIDDEAIAWQLDVIRLTMIEDALPNPITGTVPKVMRSVRAEELAPLDSPTALGWANDMAVRIGRRALREGEGAAWIGLDPLADGGGWQLVALGADLYGGAPGVSLFLAAHARLAKNAVSHELALAGLAPVRHNLHSSGAARFARVLGVGGASGLGSLVYALSTAGRLLDDDRLIEDAQRVASLMTDDVIASDKVFDIIGGTAGAILGLLKLHRETGDRVVLDRAIACGHHLLRSRRKDGNGGGHKGLGLWRHLNSRTLAGISHGAAGFAYALAALAKASGIPAFAEAARECVDYERALFSPERNNWPDLRAKDEVHWPCQWCHGAGGIGLARLGMKRFGDIGIDLNGDIAAALASTARAWPSPIDTMCCGNLGNVELLAEAGHVLGEESLTKQASGRIHGIVAAAGKAGVYGWNAGTDDENLGLFRGLAGVGYSVLRRVAPEVVPNVLIWE